MKIINYLFIFISTWLFSQDSIQTNFVKKIRIEQNQLAAIDNFGNYYFTDLNTIAKQVKPNEFIYNNMQLGEISSIDAFNALKTTVFYRDFNTVIILDNRLSEIMKIDFNQNVPFRNISHVSTGYDTTIWCFNQETQELELFDYRNKTTRVKSFPVNDNAIAMISNYNTCWLLTENYLYHYNYFGSLLKKIAHDGFTSMRESDENLILKKDEFLHYLDITTELITPIQDHNLLIKQFFVTNETLYIYDDEFLHQYQLIKE